MRDDVLVPFHISRAVLPLHGVSTVPLLLLSTPSLRHGVIAVTIDTIAVIIPSTDVAASLATSTEGEVVHHYSRNPNHCTPSPLKHTHKHTQSLIRTRMHTQKLSHTQTETHTQTHTGSLIHTYTHTHRK